MRAQGCGLIAIFLSRQAALSCGNWAAMRACAWMFQESTDALCRFRRENMLELACLLRYFFFIVNVKSLSKEALRQPVPSNHVFSALAAFFREDDHVITVAGMLCGRPESHMAAVQHLLVRMRLQRMFREVHQSQAGHALQRQTHWQGALHLNTP